LRFEPVKTGYTSDSMFLLAISLVSFLVCRLDAQTIAFPVEISYYPVTAQAKLDGIYAGNQVTFIVIYMVIAS
jgi:hypothetical protein